MTAKSKIIACTVLAVGIATAGAQTTERLDLNLEAAAKCASAVPVSPSLAAYRLLLSSKMVIRERRGSITFFAAPMAQNSSVKVWGLTPTKMVLVERDGEPAALVGSLFSADYPLTNDQIVSAFQGGLKRKLDFRPLKRSSIGGFPVATIEATVEPVFQNSHLINAKMGNGERILLCATMNQIESFFAANRGLPVSP